MKEDDDRENVVDVDFEMVFDVQLQHRLALPICVFLENDADDRRIPFSFRDKFFAQLVHVVMVHEGVVQPI